jgi:hypothetical protein
MSVVGSRPRVGRREEGGVGGREKWREEGGEGRGNGRRWLEEPVLGRKLRHKLKLHLTCDLTRQRECESKAQPEFELGER